MVTLLLLLPLCRVLLALVVVVCFCLLVGRRANLERQLGVFTGDGFPLRLLIFPEGTTINGRSMDKCTAFAKKVMKGRQSPRLRGGGGGGLSLVVRENCSFNGFWYGLL